MKRGLKWLTALTLLVSAFVFSPIVDAAAWWSQNGGKWYLIDNGQYVTGWYHDVETGRWFYFSPTGEMVTNWKKISDKWFHFGEDGVMSVGWTQIGDNWYYLAENGEMLTGWQQINGHWYFLDYAGALLKGWQQINGNWYYLGDGGNMATGWFPVDGEWYRFDAYGILQTTGYLRDAAHNEMLALVNEHRAAHGVPPLVYDNRLSYLAYERSYEIVTNFSHTRPDGSNPLHVVLYQYNLRSAGENIALNFPSVRQMFEAWKNSPGHNTNMLNPNFNVFGFAYNERLGSVQIFGTR